MNCTITNGDLTLDISPYIAYQGWKPSRNDVDGPNAGRNLSGIMIRDLIDTKRRIDVTCVPMPEETLSQLLSVLDGEGYYATYDDAQYGRVTKHMYSNNYSWQYCQLYSDGDWYFGLSFPMIEF